MCPLFLAEALNNFFNFLETKVYLDKLSLQSGDVWSHRLHHLFSTNKAENMFKAYHTMSQSNCHRLSFGIPAPVFLVWIEPDVIISGYTYFIKCEWQCIRTNKKKLFQKWSASRSTSSCTSLSACILFPLEKERQLRSLRISVALVSCQKNKTDQFMARIHHVLTLFCKHSI